VDLTGGWVGLLYAFAVGMFVVLIKDGFRGLQQSKLQWSPKLESALNAPPRSFPSFTLTVDLIAQPPLMVKRIWLEEKSLENIQRVSHDEQG
jgi:hypothetical protein